MDINEGKLGVVMEPNRTQFLNNSALPIRHPRHGSGIMQARCAKWGANWAKSLAQDKF